jgi:hypothetical protein
MSFITQARSKIESTFGGSLSSSRFGMTRWNTGIPACAAGGFVTRSCVRSSGQECPLGAQTESLCSDIGKLGPDRRVIGRVLAHAHFAIDSGGRAAFG